MDHTPLETPSIANVETRFCQAERIVRERRYGPINGALRAARERHPLFMRALEQSAEATGKAAETQYGFTRRQASRRATERAEPFVSAAFREAYATADRGAPEEALVSYYLTAALLAGLISP